MSTHSTAVGFMPLEVLMAGAPEFPSPGPEIDTHALGCLLSVMLPPCNEPFEEMQSIGNPNAFVGNVKVAMLFIHNLFIWST